MKSRRLLFISLLIFFILFGSLAAAFSADLLVPRMEMITRGYSSGGSFIFDTRGLFDISISGGYKIGGNLGLSLEGDDIASLDNPPSVLFKSASVIARDLFTLPINLSFFVGEYETFANGEIFTDEFGVPPISSKYSGYLYFPDGVQYNGIYTPSGTGFEIETSPSLSDIFKFSAYIYQDSLIDNGIVPGYDKGYYSADLRSVFNFSQIKLESFVGYTFPIARYGFFRGGILFYYDTGIGGEFLMQIGMPKWNPEADPLSIDLFYFFFEPRVHFGIFSIFITLFWHPSYYQQTTTGELGSADINLDFRLGDLNKNPYAGGLESTLKVQTPNGTSTADPISVTVSPYFSAITTGIIWNLKVNLNLFPFDTAELFEAFVGIKAEI